MFQNIKNLELLYINQRESKNRPATIRKYSAFVCRTRGQGLFHFEDKDIMTNEGDVIFIPKGTYYSYEVISGTNAEFLAITFQGEFTNPKPMLCSLEYFPAKSELYEHLFGWWRGGDSCDKYKCYAVFYELLAYVAHYENIDYAAKNKFAILEPAEQYLKKHMFDCFLTIESLHLLCGVSDTYFRNIFKEKYGMHPCTYVINRRLSQAKMILESGEFSKIYDVAHSVGYNDPLYFSQAFKKKYGILPSQIGKTRQAEPLKS